MFKFNFDIESNSTDKDQVVSNESACCTSTTSLDDKENKKPEQVDCGIFHYDSLAHETGNQYEYQQLPLVADTKEKGEIAMLKYVDSYKTKLNELTSINEINRTHDLVAGTYEGGLKVWELCIDLARFFFNLTTHENDSRASHMACIERLFDHTGELHILELGCGHSLPSLSVLKRIELASLTKSSNITSLVVYLQDFNKQIVENITFENVNQFMKDSTLFELATNDSSSAKKSRSQSKKIPVIFKFVYGDWKSILDKKLVPSDHFDLIMSTETIYNSQNYAHLLRLFKSSIRKNDANSMILLGAKTYYFGCGGNLHEFLELAKSSSFGFKCSDDLLLDFENTCSMKENSSGSSSSTSATISKEIIRMYL